MTQTHVGGNMKNEPTYQGQHRISQVYLKQFGYPIEKPIKLSVYEAGRKMTSNVNISDFTKEINVFDLPFTDPELKRHFENTSNKIETKYPVVISNLKNQMRLTPKDKDVLNHFVANILCRTYPFRTFIEGFLEQPDTRDKFINEMTMFSDNSKETKWFLSLFKIDYQLNLAIGTLMNHLVHVFRRFDKVIIKSVENKGWLTTDSPVFHEKHGHFEWIIPIESEIYMPLSKDFCLFMYHPKSKNNSNPLRKLKPDSVNEVDLETFDEITKKIVSDYDKYLIFNSQIEDTAL